MTIETNLLIVSLALSLSIIGLVYLYHRLSNRVAELHRHNKLHCEQISAIASVLRDVLHVTIEEKAKRN